MTWKLFLLCLGAAIPFGLWPALMSKSGIGNPTLTATILLTGSLIPFLPVMNLAPQLKPGTVLQWAIPVAIGVAILHGVGHRFAQYIIVNDGRDGVNLAQANVAIMMIMIIVMIAGNTAILNEPFTAKRGLAVVTAILTVLLYA